MANVRSFRHAVSVSRYTCRSPLITTAPNQAYVSFIVDAYSRMVVGLWVGGHTRTSMVLDALQMARWTRGNTLSGLTCHSDRAELISGPAPTSPFNARSSGNASTNCSS